MPIRQAFIRVDPDIQVDPDMQDYIDEEGNVGEGTLKRLIVKLKDDADNGEVNLAEIIRRKKEFDERTEQRQKEKDDRIFNDEVSLATRCMIHLEGRMLFAKDFQLLMASVGAHMADLQQTDPPGDGEGEGVKGGKGIVFNHYRGLPETCVLPVALVMPPGLSKSYPMSQWFHKTTGICPLPSKYEGTITEPGFVAKEANGGGTIWGQAFNYANGFLLFNEISNLFIASETKHSGGLINQVMESLSERSVSKTVGGMRVQYKTNLTMWGGVQPKRFDFGLGMGRRFAKLTRNWTKEDIILMKLDRMEDKLGKVKRRINMDEVKKLRCDIERVFKNGSIEEVEWDDELYRKVIFESSRSHLDQGMSERVLIGIEYLNIVDGQTVLKINNTDSNHAFLKNYHDCEIAVIEGGDYSLLINSMGSKKWLYSELWEMFRMFSYSIHQYNELLTGAEKAGIVVKSFEPNKGYVFEINKSIRKERM